MRMRHFRIPTLISSLLFLSVVVTLMYYVYMSDSTTDLIRQVSTKGQGASIFDISTIISDKKGTYTDLLDSAKAISGQNLTVLVTLVNDAYIPFTYSWLCNTKLMNIHKQVLFLTSDEESTQKLKHDWPEVSVVYLKGLSSKGDQVYSHAGYVRLMIKRTEALLMLIENDIEIFLFEVDCLWLKNPLPYLQENKNYDLLVNPVSERPGIIAGGFLYIFPTEASKGIWKALTKQLLKLEEEIKKVPAGKYISEGKNDQMYLSGLVKQKYAGIKTKILPLTEFADGKWYKFSEDKRKSLKPYVINNNWALGNKEKLTRAKKWGHWFAKDDLSCDMEQVKKLVVS